MVSDVSRSSAALYLAGISLMWSNRAERPSAIPPKARSTRWARPLEVLYRAIFGFDYFISYSWNDTADPDGRWPANSGRHYAVKLRDALRQKQFICFLDSEDYALGQNWRWFGQLALRGTSRLIVVLSPAANKSGPVLDEVRYFKARDKLVVPIEFEHCEIAESDSPLLTLIENETLRIREPSSALRDGPGQESVLKLVKTFDLTRQVTLRRRVMGLTAAALSILLLAVVYIGHIARVESANRRLAIIDESIALGVRAEALARTPVENMYTLEIGASAVDIPLKNGLDVPVQALRGLASALSNVRRSLPLTLPEGSASAARQERSKYDTMRWRFVGDPPTAVGFSKEGDRVRVATEKGMGEWDARSGKLLSWSNIALIAATNDMTSILVADEKGVTVRAPGNPEPGKRLAGSTAGSVGSLSPRGERALLVINDSQPTDYRVDIYDPSSGEIISTLRGHTARINHARFSSDGAKVVTAGADKTLRVWDSERGVQLSMIDSNDVLLCANFSSDGTRIVSGGVGKVGHVWQADTGVGLLRLQGHGEAITSAEFSSDGEQIVTASKDHSVRVWNAHDGSTVALLDGHRDGVSAAAFGPQGLIVTVSTDERLARVGSLDPDGSAASLIGHRGPIVDLAFSASGDRLLSVGDDGAVRIWSAQGSTYSQFLIPYQGPIEAARFSPNALFVLARGKDKTAYLWRALSGQPIKTLREGEEDAVDASFSPDGSTILVLSADGSLRLWDPEDSRVVNRTSIDMPKPKSAQFIGDGTRIVVGSGDGDDGQIAVLDTRTLAIVYRRNGRWTGRITCSSEVCAMHEYSGISLYRIEDGHLIKDIAIPTRMVWSATLSANGRFLVTTDQNRVVALWEPLTGELIGFLEDYRGVVRKLALSADGKVLAAGDNNDVKVATVWDVERRQRIMSLEGQRDITSLALSNDGRRIATGASDGVIKVWEISPESLLRRARTYLDTYNISRRGALAPQ